MKNSLHQIALFAGLLLSIAASAQQKETVTLSVPGFARPLAEKWAAEYQKTNTAVDFRFLQGKAAGDANTVTLSTDEHSVLFARYAVLPVIRQGSEAQQLVGSHALNAKKLRRIFFIDADGDDAAETGSQATPLHVITGNSQLSAARLYATAFHQSAADYRGKKIHGDDSFLTAAVGRDPLGITVNSLSNIFNLESRRLQPSLALLPLDIDKQARQVLSEGQLDNILQLLEQEQYQLIPTGKIGLDYDHSNPVLTAFVRWVLQDGIQYLHQYGLLTLPQKELATIR